MSVRNTANMDFLQCSRGSARLKQNCALTVEEPLVIRIKGDTDYTIMRTPGNDRELTAGFLLSEGIIKTVDDIEMLQECQDAPGLIEIKISANMKTDSASRRNMIINTSCGLCGRENIRELIKGLQPLPEGIVLSENIIYDVPGKVLQNQALFHATGATHAAALFDVAGRVGVVREDIGRHNALDKVIGNALLNNIHIREHGVFLSGRISLEMVLKAYRAGISIVTAISAPTGTAVEAAKQAGITLCGFLRGGKMCIYSHEERIKEP